MAPSPNKPRNSTPISRRRLLLQGIGAVAVAGAGAAVVVSKAAGRLAGGTVVIENFSVAGDTRFTARIPRVVKTDAQWAAELSPLAFGVTRCGDTERPFTGSYLHNRDTGLYRCICCDTALFDSRTKFDSGTGWPSFTAPVARFNILETRDDSYGMHRTAVSCRRCDAHLGHVFHDGPPPSELRYCINSAALRFVPQRRI